MAYIGENARLIENEAGVSETWQDTLIAGSVLNQSNIVTMGGNTLQLIAGDDTLAGAATAFQLGDSSLVVYSQTDTTHVSAMGVNPIQAQINVQNSIGIVALYIDGTNDSIVPKLLLTGLPTGAGYVLTDAAGDGNLTLQPATTFSTRFGFSGEDDTLGENRSVSMGVYSLTLDGVGAIITNTQQVNFVSGLDDGVYSGTYSGTFPNTIYLYIDATGTPDTFTWGYNGGNVATGVAITGSAQSLIAGMSITFAATTGHTLSDEWDYVATSSYDNQSDDPVLTITGSRHSNGVGNNHPLVHIINSIDSVSLYVQSQANAIWAEGESSFGAIGGFSTNGVGGFFESTNSVGIYSISGVGTGLLAQSNAGIPLEARIQDAVSNNTALEVLRLNRGTGSGGGDAGANGIGGYIGFRSNSNLGADIESARILSTLVDATFGSAKGNLEFWVTGVGKSVAIPSGGIANYADNAAAISAGLSAGDLYRNGDAVNIVH